MSTGDLLANTGNASRVYTFVGSTMLAVPLDGSDPTTVLELVDQTLVTFAASADGERVAALVASESDAGLTLKVLDSTGGLIGEVALSSSATPVPAGFGLYRLEWSPVVREVLLSLGTGGILEIAETGSVRTILGVTGAPSPRDIAWSPDGSAIAWVDAGADGGATGLYVASVDALPVDPVTVIRPIAGRSRQIVEIEWANGSNVILYNERAPGDDLSIGGDLFAVSPSGGTSRLVATAGRVSQVGAIGSFSISPDGDTVVYSVIVPVEGGVALRSLIARQIDGPTSANVAAEAGASLEGQTWTTSGLAWSVRPLEGSADQVVVQLAATDGTVSTLFSVRDVATPVASPVNEASPVASPQASPSPGSS